jgi:hypothetical protein
MEPGPDDLAEPGLGQEDQPLNGALVPLPEGRQEFVEFRQIHVRTPPASSFCQ